MDMKDYTLTCGEVIDNLLALADCYEKASAGKAPNGFSFSPADAAANMKAAVHFIGSFGQQLPQWISVSERLPNTQIPVIAHCHGEVGVCKRFSDGWYWDEEYARGTIEPSHWMPLPQPPGDTP